MSKQVLQKNYPQDVMNVEDPRYQHRTYSLMQEVLGQKLDLVDELSRNDYWLQNYPKHKLNDETQRINETVQKRLLLLCASPISRGLDGRSMATSIGLFIGAYASNPSLRQGFADIQLKQIDKVSETMDRFIGGDGSPLAQYLQEGPIRKMQEVYKAKANGGRVPYTAETAALAEIALIKSAYDEMREPEADIESISTAFQEARRSLRELASKDGVLDRDLKFQIGDHIERFQEIDPGFQDVFSEIRYKGYEPIPPKEAVINSFDTSGMEYEEKILVYGQGWMDRHGEMIEDLNFNPRPPLTEGTLSKLLNRELYTYATNPQKAKDFGAMSQALYTAWQEAYGKDMDSKGDGFRKGPYGDFYENYVDLLNSAQADGMFFDDTSKSVGKSVTNMVLCNGAGSKMFSDPKYPLKSAYAKSFAEASFHLDTQSEDWKEYVDDVAQSLCKKDNRLDFFETANFLDLYAKAYQIGTSMGNSVSDVSQNFKDFEIVLLERDGSKSLKNSLERLSKKSDQLVVDSIAEVCQNKKAYSREYEQGSYGKSYSSEMSY